MQPDWITDMLNRLNADLREDYEERAAIMQHDGRLPRDQAECLALLNVLRKYPMALTGLIVLKVELERETRFIVTTDAQSARQHLSSIGCNITEQTDLASVLKSEFGGVASLAKIAILYEG